MTSLEAAYERTELEPRDRLTDANCPMCNGDPCVCDEGTDQLRDGLMERD